MFAAEDDDMEAVGVEEVEAFGFDVFVVDEDVVDGFGGGGFGVRGGVRHAEVLAKGGAWGKTGCRAVR